MIVMLETFAPHINKYLPSVRDKNFSSSLRATACPLPRLVRGNPGTAKLTRAAASWYVGEDK